VIRTPLTEFLGIRHPIVQAAMGYVSGPRLAAAVSNAGGLGLIASATMSLAELEKAIEETAGRTPHPFGVNLRADAPDATERVRLIVTRRVPVASFAQAPRPELIAALKDAGVVTIASAGTRTHAEKAAGWGIDAVIVPPGRSGRSAAIFSRVVSARGPSSRATSRYGAISFSKAPASIAVRARWWLASA